jgi:hypothetical protein
MSIVGTVIGGVDTHADVHVAAAIDGNGAMLGIESFPADAAGYEELLGWRVRCSDVGGCGGHRIVGCRAGPVPPRPGGRGGGGGSTQPPKAPQTRQVRSHRCRSGGSGCPVGGGLGDTEDPQRPDRTDASVVGGAPLGTYPTASPGPASRTTRQSSADPPITR